MAYIASDAHLDRSSAGPARRLTRLPTAIAGAATGLLLVAAALWMVDGVVANAISGLTLVLGSA